MSETRRIEVSASELAHGVPDSDYLRLLTCLQGLEARALVVVAVSSGAEATELAERMWADGRPDEGFFLDRLAAGVTEVLVRQAGSLLPDPVSHAAEYASPHLSPGSAEWDIAEQSILMRLLSDADPVVCGPITLLDSGALDPAHSALAVFGLARRPPGR